MMDLVGSTCQIYWQLTDLSKDEHTGDLLFYGIATHGLSEQMRWNQRIQSFTSNK